MFPTIASYNLAIQQNGVSVFKHVRAEHFVPSRTRPLRIYSYGAGMFAVVFRIRVNSQDYALRCFLSAEQGVHDRYRLCYDYLKDKPHLTWKIHFDYLEGEVLVNGAWFPVVLMEWVDGIAINDYVTGNISNRDALTGLQEKILAAAESLTANHIGHGDLQAGNMLITSTDHQLKLIDYDSLYVPALKGQPSYERGRPEYQHPQRAQTDFNETMDWFSVWVMLTALQAVKVDASLWKPVYQGGFNTEENFLFVAEDFIRPEQSRLFKVLLDKNDEHLSFYANKLLTFCKKGVREIERPALYQRPPAVPIPGPSAAPIPGPPPSVPPSVPSPGDGPSTGIFRILSDPPATVLTQNLQRIGTTPCELNRATFNGKNIIVSYGNKTKTLRLSAEQQDYRIEFL
jgi:serine/threonine protein kinase